MPFLRFSSHRDYVRLQKWYTEREATKGGRKMERESFIFYRSFYDSIKGLGDAEFAECMRFLCEYGLNGAEQTGGTLAEVVLKMAKPQIDANNQRRSNGAKGGRPKTSGFENKNQESKKETSGFESGNHTRSLSPGAHSPLPPWHRRRLKTEPHAEPENVRKEENERAADRKLTCLFFDWRQGIPHLL